jgi:MFS family permease
MNKILRLLILNDLFFWTALGFVGPVLAIYINEDITGGTLGLTGLAMSLYWIMKSLTSLVVSRFTDREKGNRAELITLVVGSTLAFLVPFGYLAADSIIEIIVIQFVFGAAVGLLYPGWMTLFTRFLEKDHEGFTWSLDMASVSLGNGIAIAVSGFIAEAYGFNILFYFVILLNFISLLMILALLKYKKDILKTNGAIKGIIRKVL